VGIDACVVYCPVTESGSYPDCGQALQYPAVCGFRRHAQLSFLFCDESDNSHRKSSWIDSSLFALSLGFALVVMYDAAGVRYAVGRQAIILNQMMEDYQHHRKDRKLTEHRLKELIGHTRYEVVAGAVLGIAVALWLI
jgi:hypothetical protein